MIFIGVIFLWIFIFVDIIVIFFFDLGNLILFDINSGVLKISIRGK